MPKQKSVAIYAANGCGGCSQSLLVSDRLSALVDAVHLAFWATQPGDVTQAEIEQYDDREIDILLYAGPVYDDASIATAQLLRRKAKRIVAYGACAHLGGLCGLANLVPGATLHLAPSNDGRFIQPLAAVIDVDYILPGCPPPQEMITRMVDEVFFGDELPPAGTVFAATKAVCAECNRRHLATPLTAINRFHATLPDPEVCLLDQGYICLGPVTRGGCAAVCPRSNRPCTGCAGPLAGARDQGGAVLYALASLVRFAGPDGQQRERKVLDSIPDIVGTAYKYSVAASALKRKVNDGS